ncbi:MAG: hypothetical protein HC827_10255 [Cyanobacteria bacterium RM1_2_2]|nr:hypothetical protein [Cyanobacteria bacterium RM1_2_2]
MIEARLRSDPGAQSLIDLARQRLQDDPLKNALAAFYLQSASQEGQAGSVEFAHKSFGEFLCATRLKESLEEWSLSGIRRQEFYVSTDQMDWEICDLLGYGGLTPEIVEYLITLTTASSELDSVRLFKRLENFYLRWYEGEFIDEFPENLPQKKMRLLGEHLTVNSWKLGQRQVDVYVGLNVLILLLELHRYAQSNNQLHKKIIFHACGQKSTEGFDPLRLLNIIGYSHCVSSAGMFSKCEKNNAKPESLTASHFQPSFLTYCSRLNGCNPCLT